MVPLGEARLVGVFCLLFTASRLSAAPTHVVLGYSEAGFDNIYPPESYNYDALTHIARSFLIPKADGTIAADPGFWDPTLERLAHAHGVKLLAALGGDGGSPEQWLGMAGDPKAEKRFFDNLEALVHEHRYDGVDIDWEPSARNESEQAIYTKFMKDLRRRFPRWILTTALGSGIGAPHVSWAEVAEQVDWINWMTYNFAGIWNRNPRSSHNSNLYPPADAKADTGRSIDQDLMMLETKYHLPAGKAVLGLPFYGVQFFQREIGDPYAGPARKFQSYIEYYEIAPLLEMEGFKVSRDEGAKAPYLQKPGRDLVISYDDPESVRAKCEYAAQKGLKGVMIWNLGADVAGARTPLLDAVAAAYGAAPAPMPVDGLLRTFQAFADKIRRLRGKLADPGPEPDLSIPDSRDVQAIGRKLWTLQSILSRYGRQLQASRDKI